MEFQNPQVDSEPLLTRDSDPLDLYQADRFFLVKLKFSLVKWPFFVSLCEVVTLPHPRFKFTAHSTVHKEMDCFAFCVVLVLLITFLLYLLFGERVLYIILGKPSRT